MVSRWKQIRYRLECASFRAASSLVPKIPYGLIDPLAGILSGIAYAADARGRATAMGNLQQALGHRGYSDADLRGIARRSFHYFGRSQLEALWSRNLTAENYGDYMNVVYEDPETEALARDRGAIWVTPHYGNFEWISLMFGFRGLPFRVVAQDFKNPLLTPLFAANRERSGHVVIPQQGAMLRLLRHLKSGGNVAFLTDLNIKPDKAASVITSFGMQSCVTRLHAELAARTGLPVIPAICLPQSGGYEMRLLKPLWAEGSDGAEDLAQRCWDVLEPHILAYPEPWLWAYKHWRYRPRHPERPYPPYAQRSWRFESLAMGLDPKSPPPDWHESLKGNPV